MVCPCSPTLPCRRQAPGTATTDSHGLFNRTPQLRRDGPPPNRCLLHTLLGASASPVEPVYCCVPHAQVHRSPEVPCRSKVSIHAILMAAESFALALLDIVHRPEFWTQNYSGSQSDRSKYKRDLFAKSNFEKHPSPSAALILRIGTL